MARCDQGAREREDRGAREQVTGPLNGIRIVEFAGIGPAPFCGMTLADMGADVIRVDRPPDISGNRSKNHRFDVLARGRQSIALDLKKAGARDIALRLAERADALIEGLRPGVMERLGLGPDVCLELNPRLVYGRMTGWGQYGPLAHAAGHDINYIALSGVLHSIGLTSEPPVPPLNLVGDFGGGGMILAFGVVCGILEAQRSGKGSGCRRCDDRWLCRVDGGYLWSETVRTLDKPAWQKLPRWRSPFLQLLRMRRRQIRSDWRN